MAKIVVIDGQGGRLGKLLVEEVKARLPQAELLAVGTNGIASSAMQKAGASQVATGENPVVRGVMDADVVLGPLGIVVAHAHSGRGDPQDGRGGGGLPGQEVSRPHEQLRRGGGRSAGAEPVRPRAPGGRPGGGVFGGRVIKKEIPCGIPQGI